MSYALAFAGDSRPDFSMLELWLQEEVLDELELLVANPWVLNISRRGEAVHAFSRDEPGARNYISMTLGRNDASRTITVLGIATRKLNLPPSS